LEKGQKELVLSRDSTSNTEFLYKCVMDIYAEPHKTYGIKNTIGITFTIMELLAGAITNNGQGTVDVIAAFFKGTSDVPELECVSAYTEYLFQHAENKKAQKVFIENENSGVVEQKKIATSLLSTYSKGVELLGKIFTHLLSLSQIENNIPFDLLENSQLTIYQKTEQFIKHSNGKYDKLTTLLDRNVRNADSHNNAYFSTDEKAYIMKKTTRGKGGKIKTETFKIPWITMVMELYPKIGWLLQGFISAGILLILSMENKALYNLATKQIMDINDNPAIL
jgi:hypothetical protein